MIQVGIQDNVRITGAAKNEKGSLVLSIQQDAGGSSSLLDALSSTSTQASENDQDIIMWPVQEDDRLITDAEKFKDVLNRLKVFRAQLNHFLEQYVTADKIHWNPTVNLGVDTDTELNAALMDAVRRPVIVAGIYNNYVDQFAAQMAPYATATSALFRMKLQRTSKDKNFPTIPKFVPFIEPMSVKKTASQLKWSKYDLGFRKGDLESGPYSGLNLSDPSQVEGAGAKVDVKETANVAHLFGK